MNPFDDLDYTRAAGLVVAPDGFAEAEAMAYRDEPDQIDCGGRRLSGFLGPTGLDLRGLSEVERRDPLINRIDESVTSDLRRSFVEVDRLGELLDRRVDGPLGHKPRVVFEVARTLAEGEEPTPDEKARLAELDAVIAWGEAPRTDVHRLFRRVFRAASCFGRGFARPFVPAGRLVEEQRVGPDGMTGTGRFFLPRVTTINDALQHVFGEALTPDRAVVHEDEDTRAECAVVRFDPQRTDAYRRAVQRPASVEVSFVDDADGAGRVNGRPVTVVRQIDQGTGWREMRAPLRGRTHLVELRDDGGAFIDGPARRLQKAINTASTEERIVLDEDGFRVRVLLGARPPGRWESKVNEATGQREPVFVPEPWAISPSTVLNVGGEEVYADKLGPDGLPVVTAVSEPKLGTFEAANPEGYRTEVAERTLQLRERAKQGWVHTTGEAGVSGVSREVAMADYLTDATTQAQSIEAAAATYYELVADLAAHLVGQPGRYYDIVARVECRVSKPPMRPEEEASVANLMEKRLISRRRAMQRVGVDDAQAEIEEIGKEQDAESERRRGEANALFGLSSAPGAVTPQDLEEEQNAEAEA